MSICYTKATKEKGEARILGKTNKERNRQETEWLGIGRTCRKPGRRMKCQDGKKHWETDGAGERRRESQENEGGEFVRKR